MYFEEEDFREDQWSHIRSRREEDGGTEPVLPLWAYTQIRTITEAKSHTIWDEFNSVFDDGGVPSNTFRSRAICQSSVAPDWDEVAWLERQIQLCGTEVNSDCVVIFDSSGEASLHLSLKLLLQFHWQLTQTGGDFIIAPTTMAWALYSYHHGDLTFVRLD